MVSAQTNEKASNSFERYFFNGKELRQNNNGISSIVICLPHSVKASCRFMVYSVLSTVTKNTDCKTRLRKVNIGLMVLLQSCINVCAAKLASIIWL